MKKIWAVSLIVILVLSFQNCEQSARSGYGTLSSTGVQVGIPDQSSQSRVTITEFEIPNVADSAGVSSKSTEGFGPYRLLVSLENGELELLDSDNNILQKRCLSESELSEGKTILADSKICETKVQSDLVCGMRFKYAYASLYSEDQRVALGEEQDTCGRGKKDLCGGLAKVFQAYVSHIRANWAQMNCE